MGKSVVKKMLFIVSKAHIDSAYAGMVMANGARMEGIEAEVFFTFFGLDVITKKKMKNLKLATVGNPGVPVPTMLGGLPGMEAFASMMMRKEMLKHDMPPVDEFIEILSASGCKIWACKLAVDMFKLTEKDLVDELDGILTIGDFYERADVEGTQIVFI